MYLELKTYLTFSFDEKAIVEIDLVLICTRYFFLAGRKIQLFAATKPGITLTQLGPLVLRSIALATVVSALLLLLPLSSIVCYRWQSAQNPSEIRSNPSWHLINVLPSEPLAPCNTFASRNELEMYVCQRAYFIDIA